MNFGDALALMEDGATVTRQAWEKWEKAPRMVWIQDPIANHPPQTRYLCKTDADGAMVPYTATNESILAQDWKVVE